MIESHSITITDFFNTVFPPDLLEPDEIPLISRPNGEYFVQRTASQRHLEAADKRDAGWLFCVSTVVVPERGERVRRRMSDLRYAYALVLDDIGTKAIASRVVPSYILETSPGNFQHGFLIDPFDVRTRKGQAYYDACLVAAADAGLSDPGMRSATRVAKVPGAIHKTGFVTRVVRWKPGFVWNLPGLMDQLDVVPRPRKVGADPAAGKYTDIGDVKDPLMHWLSNNWTVRGFNDFGVHIACPWEHEHTDGEAGSPSSTSYSPLDFGLEGAGFKCLHGHCQGRGVTQLNEWAHGMGYRSNS